MEKRERLLFYSITVLGISCIITQIILIREFLSIFYGNELVLGILFANWLLLTGIGAWFGRFFKGYDKKIGLLIFFQALIAFMPFLQVLIIRDLRNIVSMRGALMGFNEMFFSSFIILAPYCLVSGALLTLACIIFDEIIEKREKGGENKSVGRVYFMDNIGDIIGGALFSFVFIYFFKHIESLFFVSILNLAACFFLADFIKNRRLKVFIVMSMLCLFFTAFYFDVDNMLIKRQYPGQEVLFNENSIYGSVVVTKTDEQLNFFENGLLLFSTQNMRENEEKVHFAMIQHDNPRKILLLSGGASGTTLEILKYDVERIDYVELDEVIVKVGKRYTSNIDDERIKVITRDARLFVRNTNESYDVVIIDLDEPNNLQVNRFYTLEFFGELRKRLNESGIVGLSLVSSENYMSEELVRLNSAIYKTLKSVFINVIVLPGETNYFIASDSNLTYDIAKMIKKKGIETRYVNEAYLKGVLTSERINGTTKTLDENAGRVKVNRDFKPVVYYYHALYWLSQFKTKSFLILLVTVILVFLYTMRLKPVSFAVFNTGMAASGLELITLFGFQMVYGYVYSLIGVVITFFMLGLAIGSFIMNKSLSDMNLKDMARLQFFIACFAIMLPIFLSILLKINLGSSFFVGFIFSVLTLVLGFLAGMVFPLASRLYFRGVARTASSIYNADLMGGFVGAIFIATILVPVLGVFEVCFVISALSLLSSLLLWIKISNVKR